MKNLNFLKSSLIAHRGVHDLDIPENSIGAFKLAIEKNYIIEFDVHLLKDNTVIVFHDDNLLRMTGVDRNLCECEYDFVKNLRLINTKYKIPTLEKVLKLVNGKVPIIIELKYDRKVGLLEKEVSKLLDNYNGLFCVKSFSPFIVRWFKRKRPNYIRGLLISDKNRTIREKFCQSFISGIICKPDFISCNYRLSNNKQIMKYMKKIPVLAWTIKSSIDYLKYKDKFYNLIAENIDKF